MLCSELLLDKGPGAVVEDWPAAAEELEEVSLGLRGGDWSLNDILQWELRLVESETV